MNEISLPEFLGNQCRKYRRMRGLTQAQLGDLIGVTEQSISNYETNGISKVEIEDTISKALGVNLREDAADKEGIVGEVGKEILFLLIENGGSCEVKYLEENELYGMSKERVNHEIAKIAELDMCSRDRYIDLYGNERDDLFITAKGIITYKNLVSDDYHAKRLREYLPNVKSYEMMLVPSGRSEMSLPVARDMEEYVELRKWKPLIYKISILSNYKADYIAHLYHRWANSVPRVTGGLLMADDVIKNFFPGVSAYHDIIYRMAYGYTNVWRNETFFESRFNISKEAPKELFDGFDWDDGIDTVRDEALMEFIDEFKVFKDSYYPLDVEEERETSEWQDYMKYLKKIGTDEEVRLSVFKNNVNEEKYNMFPDQWFSKDEIETFIRENYAGPKTDWEKEQQSIIEEVEKLIPCKDEYYRFTKEWEENGLADLVRKLCC